MKFFHKSILVFLAGISLSCYALNSESLILPNCQHSTQDGLGICIENSAGNLSGLGFSFVTTTTYSAGFVNLSTFNGYFVIPSFYLLRTEYSSPSDSQYPLNMKFFVLDKNNQPIPGCTHIITSSNNHLKLQLIKQGNLYYCEPEKA